MSRDALAGVYTLMLSDPSHRKLVSASPEVLDSWDLSDEEKKILLQEAKAVRPKTPIENGPVLSYLAEKRGPLLSPGVASGLGIAINQAVGLPIGSLSGPGFLSNAACCPWGHPVVGKIQQVTLPG